MATGDRIEIGRDPSCGVHLDDESCSRKHALLFFHDGQLAIQDLGSANGTSINRQPITGPRLVSPRDEVGIGRYQIKLKTVESQLPQAAGGINEPPATQALVQNPASPGGGAHPSSRPGGAAAPAAPNPLHPTTPAPMTDAAMANIASFSSEEGDPTLVESPGSPQLPSPYSLDSDPTVTAGQGVSPLATHPDPQSLASSSAGGVSLPPAALSPAVPAGTPSAQLAGPPTPQVPPAAGPQMAGIAMEPTADKEAVTRQVESPLAALGGVPTSPVGALLDTVTLAPEASAPLDPQSIRPSKTPPPPPEASDAEIPALTPQPGHPTSGHPTSGPAPASGATAPVAGPVTPPPPPASSGPVDVAPANAAAGGDALMLPDADAADAPLPHVDWRPGDYEPADVDNSDADAPGWSLVQRIVRAIEPEPDEKVPAVEVVHYRGERVIDQATLAEGEAFRFGRTLGKADLEARGLSKPIDVVGHRNGHIAEVVLADGLSGRVLRQGQQVDIKSLPEAKAGKVPLTDGDLASLEIGGDRLFVRFGRAVNLPVMEAYEAELKRERRRQTFAAVAAVMVVLVGGISSWIYQYRALKETVIQLEDDGFAEVKKELELEFKEPKPKPKPKKIELPAPKKEETKVALKPEPVVPKESDVGGKKEAPKKPGVLDALKNLPPKTAGAQSLTKALSNVKGVKVPGASGYKVSAMTAKGVKGVSIGGASGGVDTSSLNSLLRKGGGGSGPGKLAGRSTKKVKGRVKTLKRRSKVKGQGTLSREEIQKVVRSLIGKIQYCYEKQLRTNSGLAGKVVLEWTIKTSGRVGVVKTGRGTTLKSSAAISCMQKKLKGAQFPKPKGGSVIVTYPFIFNTL